MQVTHQNPFAYVPMGYQPPNNQQQQLNFQAVQPVQYPQFFQPQPMLNAYPQGMPQAQHLNAMCTVHQFPLDSVCRSPVCSKRLLCRVCAEEHSRQFSGHQSTISPLEEILSDTFLVQLNKYISENRGNDTISDIHLIFEDLKIKTTELLAQAEEKAQQKAREFFLIKQIKGWSHLQEEYMQKKDAFKRSSPGTETLELVQLVDVVNKIKEKQAEFDKEVQETLKAQRNQTDKFLLRLKEYLGLVTDNLFEDKTSDSQILPTKVDPEYMYYAAECKGEHKLLLNAVTYVPKFDQFVTATEAGFVSVWNSATLTQIGTYKIHNDAINALLYVESEGLLVSASKDKSVRLTPIREQGLNIKKVEIFRSHTAPVRSLLYLEGEDRFVSAGEEADIRVWNLKTKNLDTIINTKGWKVTGDEMAFVRPERWIVAAGRKEIRIYDYVTRELVLTTSVMKMMGSISYLSEKKMLVAQTDNDRVQIWKVDGVKKKLKKEKKVNLKVKVKGPVYFRCFENNDLMLVSLRTNKVAVVKISTGQIVRELDTSLTHTTSVTLLKKERRIIIGDAGSNRFGVFQY